MGQEAERPGWGSRTLELERRGLHYPQKPLVPTFAPSSLGNELWFLSLVGSGFYPSNHFLPLPGSAPVFKDAIGPYGNLDTSENFFFF